MTPPQPKKLPSERHWTIGAPAFLGGCYSANTRETANWRVDLTLRGTGKWGESGRISFPTRVYPSIQLRLGF